MLGRSRMEFRREGKTECKEARRDAGVLEGSSRSSRWMEAGQDRKPAARARHFICIIIASSCSNPDCDRSKVTFPEVRSKDRRSGWLVGAPLGREGAGVEAARVSGLQSPSRCWSLQVMAAPQAHDLLPQPRSLSAALGQPRSPSDACSPFLAQRQGSPHRMPPGL